MRIKNIEVDQKWNRGVLRLVFRSSDWLIDLVQSLSRRRYFKNQSKWDISSERISRFSFCWLCNLSILGFRPGLMQFRKASIYHDDPSSRSFPSVRSFSVMIANLYGFHYAYDRVHVSVRAIVHIAAYDRSNLTIVDLIVFMPFESFGFLISKFIIQGYRGRRWVSLCPVRHHQLDTPPRVWKNCINLFCIF